MFVREREHYGFPPQSGGTRGAAIEGRSQEPEADLPPGDGGVGTRPATQTREGRHEFLFVSVPLNVTGAIGSPANAVAVL